MNNSVTIGLRFLLLSMSAIISSKAINILHFYLGGIFQCFYKFFEYSIKALESLILLITLNNKFVFPDLESPIINILYGCSRISGQFGLCPSMFSFVTSSKLTIFPSRFVIMFHLIFFIFTY